MRKALEDEIQAVLNGKKKAEGSAVKAPEEGRRADAALCRADLAEAARHELTFDAARERGDPDGRRALT